ncbi:MAG: SRPBCC family protein [Leptospira sp.]|nr:SRPBCC family protein [Leptospira sp.]
MKNDIEFNPELDLILERIVDIPPNLVWDAWTKPEHIVHWFTPAPWKTIECEIDLVPGGKFRTVMQSPEGEKMDTSGCYLDIIPEKRLVWTDNLLPGFRPSENGFFTAILTLESVENGTKYKAHAMHKSPKNRKSHEDMGFTEGWGKALEQLVAYMKSV